MTNIQSDQPLSLSKDKIKVLFLEGINDSGVDMMTAAGYSSVTRLSKALDGGECAGYADGVGRAGARAT